MSDLISRQAAIDALADYIHNMDKVIGTGRLSAYDCKDAATNVLAGVPSAQPDNQVNLCDSCKYSYPDCPSEANNVIFGNGKGNDNICACNKYLPFVQSDNRLEKIADLVEGTIDHFDLDDAMDLLYQIKGVLKDGRVNKSTGGDTATQSQ